MTQPRPCPRAAGPVAVIACAALILAWTPGPSPAGLLPPPPPPEAPQYSLITELVAEPPPWLDQDAAGGPRVGAAVAMYGDTLAVGAPNARIHPNFEQGGAVFVYRLTGGQWQLRQSIPFDFFTLPGSHSHCGHAVSLDAYNLLIGCPGQNSESGRVMRFERPSADAPFELANSSFVTGGLAGHRCGGSLALLGTADSNTYPLAAVGCPGAGGGHGAVEILFYCPPFAPCAGILGVGWHPAASLAGSNVEGFGHSISMSGYLGTNVLLAVGAPNRGVNNDGRVYVFNMTGTLTDWNPDATYDGMAGDRLGYSVHLRSDTSIARLAAGAPTRTVVAPAGGGGTIQVPVGGFTVMTRSLLGWAQNTQEVTGAWVIPAAVPQHRLGHAVIMPDAGAAARVIAGEPEYPAGAPGGRARHYLRDTGTGDWHLNAVEPFYSSPAPLAAASGTALAADGGWLAIGVPGYPEAGARPMGRVMIYAYQDGLLRDRFEAP